MTEIQITHDAKCKHCAFCRQLTNKTYCEQGIERSPENMYKIWPNVIKPNVLLVMGKQIKLNDKACLNFKLFGS